MATPSIQSAPELVETEVSELTEEQKKTQAEKEFFDGLTERFGPDAPDASRLNAWKDQCGRVRWMEFGVDEIYFYRPYKSAEYKGWLKSIRAQNLDNDAAFELLKDRVVTTCILWPKIDAESTGALFGGTIETLYEQINLASNFIPVEQAVQLVREW